MPTQDLGIEDDNVKIVTVDSATGDIVNSLLDHSPTNDSVDGTVPAHLINPDIKALDTLQAALDNITGAATNSDGTVHVPESFASSVVMQVPSVTGSTISTGDAVNTSIVTTDTLGGTTTVPHVLRVDAKDVSKVLGKRPMSAISSGAQNSIVNKVIITKNPSTSQPHAVPIQIQTLPVSHAVYPSASGTQVQNSPRTPTKTITISQQGIVSPIKGITMAQVIGSPPKLPISKLPISPAKTPTKITMIPVSVPGRSPQRIAPAGLGQTLLNNNASNAQTTITMSPSKVIKQPGTVQLIQKSIQPSLSNASVVTIPGVARPGTGTVRQVAIQPGNVQQIHVPGSKFHYIRLAAPPTTSQAGTAPRPQVVHVPSRPSVPAVSVLPGQTHPTQVKITIPAQSVAGTQIMGARQMGTATSAVQRIILPAGSNQVSIRPGTSLTPGVTAGTHIIRSSLPSGTGTLAQLAGGTSGVAPTIINAGGGNSQQVQGFALVPASYLSQIQQQIQVKPAVTSATAAPLSIATTTAIAQTQARSDYVPIASSNPAVSNTAQNKNVNGTTLDAGGGARPRKPCNCTKSQCLKLYCDCFANGEFCHNCNCMNCANNLENEEQRSRAIKTCLERNPLAFHPKIGKGRSGEKDRRHNKGCNCKRSGCLKNYCECYEAKIMCGTSCKCIGCKNFEESPERKTLMHLADAAEVRVQQQTAAKTKLSSQISDVPLRPTTATSGPRLPFSFVTSDVVDATCACLLAQAEEADRQRMPPVVQERMVIEEFGRCLRQIIESANRTKAPDPDDTS